MGVLVNSISHSFVVGCTVGAALLIAAQQLKHFFGVTMVSGTRVRHLRRRAIVTGTLPRPNIQAPHHHIGAEPATAQSGLLQRPRRNSMSSGAHPQYRRLRIIRLCEPCGADLRPPELGAPRAEAPGYRGQRHQFLRFTRWWRARRGGRAAQGGRRGLLSHRRQEGAFGCIGQLRLHGGNGARKVFQSKHAAFHGIYQKLDKPVCETCERRIFNECRR